MYPRWRSAYSLYGLTILFSAFLLFVIQPIAGKHLLPYFGGSASVWAMSLIFFTAVLFLGYAYVYLICKTSQRLQVRIHLLVTTTAVFAVIISLWMREPSQLANLSSGGNPWLSVLFALFASIGIPYFLLSTTGPLVQYWYGLSGEKEPYILYALSNVGSLSALIAYPFFIERLSTLPHQELVWVLAFLGYSLLLTLLCSRYAKVALTPPISRTSQKVPWGHVIAWFLFSFTPSFALIAVTTQITQTIAPVPLLWIVPLLAYLLTFILAFSGHARSSFISVLLLVSAGGAIWLLEASLGEFYLSQIIVDIVFLFFVGLMCHGALYDKRPGTPKLPLFYLVVSFGGMCGALTAGMLVPFVFKGFWEFPVSIWLGAAIAISLLLHRFLGKWSRESAYVLQAALITSLLFAGCIYVRDHQESAVYASRNFYGLIKVEKMSGGKVLLHGSTVHGFQLSLPGLEFIPTSYYTASSAVSRALVEAHKLHPGRGLKVGVMGLGTGTIASYCADRDAFVFYELDPRIVELAERTFTYLSTCANVEVRVGDGRLTLAKEQKQGELGGYDLLILDAFSNDTIPVHLLTKEAFELYLSHLRDPDSVIVINASNKYVNLGPTLMRMARELHLASLLTISHPPRSEQFGYASEWVLLTRDPKLFRTDAFRDIAIPFPQDPAPLWTDDYSNILSVLWIPDSLQQLLTGRINAESGR